MDEKVKELLEKSGAKWITPENYFEVTYQTLYELILKIRPGDADEIFVALVREGFKRTNL